MTDVTANRALPLPHPNNNAAEDAMRLRTALGMIDAALAEMPGLVTLAIEALVGQAPETLDTLAEIAAALGNDPNLAATLTAQIAAKQPANANLTALAGLAGEENKAPYFTAAGALALMTISSKGRELIACADAAAMRSLLGTAAFALLAGHQTLTGGFEADSYAVAMNGGTLTPDPKNGNLQHVVNQGAHTLTPPTKPCTMILEYWNQTAAGLTASGFSKVTGAAFNSGAEASHILYVTRTKNFSHLHIVALS
ncbi:hypothetical protein KQX64_07125 [Rhodopseudomonas palustris]|nr:hypothetical protein KQX64_07125 [Rhodopseudomonas palustris]